MTTVYAISCHVNLFLYPSPFGLGEEEQVDQQESTGLRWKKKTVQGEGEEGKTDFVEDGRSLEQASVLDSREEDRLREAEQHGGGMLTGESTNPHRPYQCLAFQK